MAERVPAILILSNPLPLDNTNSENGNTNMRIDSFFGHQQMRKISLITKVYVWSVVLEPLLFFVIWDRTTAGISGNLSRILQILVIIALILRYFTKPSGLRIANIAHPIYRNYSIYIGIAIFAGLIGGVFGGYNISVPFFITDSQSNISRLISSPAIRPLFEYLIAIYYFVYFAILPRYMLKTKSAVLYFISVFKNMFIISLVIGVIDLAFNVVGIQLVPRHLADWVYVGSRFHGLAGEPRDAFVYLFLGLAVLYIEAYLKKRSLNKMLVVTVIAAAVMTQSASGIIGIAVFLGLYAIYSLTRAMSGRSFLLLLTILSLTATLVYGAIIRSERLQAYLKSTSEIWQLLESKAELPYLMQVQSSNIYPLYDLIVKAREMNILPILFGSGLGSVSVINNKYSPYAGEMMNPNSQLVRALFESGIVGSFFLIMSFVYPVKQLTKHIATKNRRTFMILTLLLIGCFMGQRTAAPFIYLGIFLATFYPLLPISDPPRPKIQEGSLSG